MIKKLFVLIISIILSINCISISFAEDTYPNSIFENDYKTNKLNHFNTNFANNTGGLYIENGDKELYYIDNNPSEEPIDGLVVSYDDSSSTYIINVTKDVTITSNNEDAISSREGYNLKIIGNHTLTINLNLNSYNHEYTYGIYSTNHLQIGEENTSDRLKIIVNDTFIMSNNNEYSNINSYSYALCSSNGIDIYNSDVSGNITSFLAFAFQGDINVNNSKLNHNVYAKYTIPNFVDDDNDELTCEFSTLYTEDYLIYIKNNSIVNTSFVNFSDKSDIFFNGLVSHDLKIEDSSVDLCAYAFAEEFGIYMAPKYFQAGSICINECIITNSNIKIRNFFFGFAAQFSLKIINSNFDSITYSGGLYTYGILSIFFDDNSRYNFNIITTYEGEFNFENQTFLSAIAVFTIVGEDFTYTPTPNNLQISLPTDAYLNTDVDNEYVLTNNNLYRQLKLIYLHEPVIDFDLSICDTKYKKNDIVYGTPIDNIGVSYDNGLYTLNILGDVELTAYDNSAIICNNFDLKIIGEGNLIFNLVNYDTSVENYCYAINTGDNLQIGELNSNDKLVIKVNDEFSMNNNDKSILNSYTYGIKAGDDINIYNTKIIGNITCDLICSSYKNINLNNSELIHNIYSNYKYPGIYKNESGIDFVTLYAEDNITLNNNSSIKSLFVDYIPESCIFYDGFECDDFIMSDSSIDLKNSYNLETEQGRLNSNAISCGKFEATNSDIKINNFLFGIIGERISLTNTNVNMKNYSSGLIAVLKILVKYDNDNYNFDIISTNTRDISFEDGILPAITFFDGENIVVPNENMLVFDLPNTLKVISELDDPFVITNNNDYRHVSIVKTNPDKPYNPPYNPTHYVVPKTGIK